MYRVGRRISNEWYVRLRVRKRILNELYIRLIARETQEYLLHSRPHKGFKVECLARHSS